MRWIYLFALLPTLTEYAETGDFGRTPRVYITEVVLTTLIIVGAWLIGRQSRLLIKHADTDALTDLNNRRRFHIDLEREVERARRQRSALAVAYADLDFFKQVNDRWGHSAGDKLLILVARVLRECCRKNVDSCYRIGGDEFAVIFPGATETKANEYVDRLAKSIDGVSMDVKRFGVTVSIGLVELQSGETSEALLRRADRLMYTNKYVSRRAAS